MAHMLLTRFRGTVKKIDNMRTLQVIISTGSNRYCLDKNYAGFLIIWDRMFGTFEWERKGEKIVYGLVDQPQYFNPIRHQVKLRAYLLIMALKMSCISRQSITAKSGPKRLT